MALKEYVITNEGRREILWEGMSGTMRIGFQSYAVIYDSNNRVRQGLAIVADPSSNKAINEAIQAGLLQAPPEDVLRSAVIDLGAATGSPVEVVGDTISIWLSDNKILRIVAKSAEIVDDK